MGDDNHDSQGQFASGGGTSSAASTTPPGVTVISGTSNNAPASKQAAHAKAKAGVKGHHKSVPSK